MRIRGGWIRTPARSESSTPRTVLGIDGCRAGWVGVWLAIEEFSADAGSEHVVTASVAPSIDALVAGAPAETALAQVAVDVPIGLVDAGRRAPEPEARRILGRRASTVFEPPVTAAAEAEDYAAANAAHRQATGRGLSRQAFGLVPAITEVARWRRESPAPVAEAHPELSFAALTGRVLEVSKHKPEGLRQRHAALTSLGITVPAAPSGVAEHDLLDACALAWTAWRVLAGEATSLPPGARPDDIAMWT